MSPIVHRQPKERLLNLLTDKDSETRIIPLPKYCCPFCNDITVYSVGQGVDSLFPKELRLAFDAAEAFRGEYRRGFTDFLCRVCHIPVRVVYRIEEFHMASFRYDAVAVYEPEYPVAALADPT
jgi:hypothetical protein